MHASEAPPPNANNPGWPLTQTRSQTPARVWFSAVWLAALFLASVAATVSGAYWINIGIWPMLYHGGHELLHLSLFAHRRSKKTNKQGRSQHLRRVEESLGAFVFALLGHNYYLLRVAHLEHHVCGREPFERGLMDHRTRSPSFVERLEYWAALLGLNYWAYIGAGYIYAVSPALFRRLFYRVRLARSLAFLGAQVACALWAVYVVTHAPLEWVLLTHVVFGVYWGTIQNLAHYALPIGGAHAQYASRSYRVPSWIHFAFFGSPFSHLEHHVAPHLPGVLLADSEASEAVLKKLNVTGYPKLGLVQYATDLVRQFRGPTPRIEADWYW